MIIVHSFNSTMMALVLLWYMALFHVH